MKQIKRIRKVASHIKYVRRLKIERTTVTAKHRQLSAGWTVEYGEGTIYYNMPSKKQLKRMIRELRKGQRRHELQTWKTRSCS